MEDFITTAQLAELLEVDRSTVIRRIQRGQLVPDFTAPGKVGVHLFDPEKLFEDDESN